MERDPMTHRQRATDSAAQEILGYTFFRIFVDDGTIDEAELRFIEELALRDGVVDSKERAVLSRIFDRVDPARLSAAVRREIARFREEYDIP